MVSRSSRFNIYLLLLTLVALTGCQSPEAKRNRQLATVLIYLEVPAGRAGQALQATVLRAAPMLLNVERDPFLNNAIHLATAEIVDTPGGFVLSMRLNHKGALLLEQYTASHRNRRMAIRCQWGVAPNVQDRWLAAPLITKRISDGVINFTPDATREEVEEIVIGLNNYGGNAWLKEKPYSAPESGGKK